MADEENTENKPDGAQAAADGNAQEANAAAQAGDGEETISAEDARKLRSEAKNLRERAKAAEKERDALKAAGMSDTEKRDADLAKKDEQITTLESELRNLRVQAAAGGLGFVDPETATRLLDWDEIDDPSDKSQVEKALRNLAKAKPFLMGGVANGADAGAGRQTEGRTSESVSDLIRRRAGRTPTGA